MPTDIKDLKSINDRIKNVSAGFRSSYYFRMLIAALRTRFNYCLMSFSKTTASFMTKESRIFTQLFSENFVKLSTILIIYISI
jgi:hypothetical protein